MLKLHIPPTEWPCHGQTVAETTAYYRAAQEGTLAMTRGEWGGMLTYTIDRVTGTNPRSGRVYLSGRGAFFTRSGAICDPGEGQCSLVVPSLKILEWGEARSGTHAVNKVQGISLDDVKAVLAGTLARLPTPPLPTLEE